VGCLLEQKEGFPKEKADALRKCLKALAKYGLADLPKTELARLGYAMLRYRMHYQDGVDLYGKYVANWGGEATVWTLEGCKDGQVVSRRTVCPSAKLHLELQPSHTRLFEKNSYDMAAVRIRILDENGNPAPFAQMPVTFRLEGAAELIGPNTVTAEGGMCGTYLRTTDKKGTAVLTVSAYGLEDVAMVFESC
jgi:beta-galactosidase